MLIKKKTKKLNKMEEIAMNANEETETKRFSCDGCDEEWEEGFKCDKCSGWHYVPDYNEEGFDEEGDYCLLSTCLNCCSCHHK